ncbi:MAG: PEP-CTERM sorting domain-containing protein, partial [Lacipirellulaceae bacterium]
DSTPVVLTFTGALPAAGDATLSLFATGGELANNNKRLEQLMVDGDGYQTAGDPAGWIRPVNFLDGANQPVSPVTIPLASLDAYVADGEVQVSVVRPGFIAGGTFDVTLEYTTSIPEPSTLWLLGLGSLSLVSSRRR